MTIKFTVLIATAIAIGLSLIIALLLFLENQQLGEIIEENRIANEIGRGVFETNILTNGYILHRGQRSRIQWWLRYKSTARLLIESERIENPKERAVIESLHENHKAIGATFFQLVTVLGRKAPGIDNSAASEELEERLKSQLSIKARAMASAAFTLAIQTRRKLTERQNRLNMFFFNFYFDADTGGNNRFIGDHEEYFGADRGTS